MFKDFKLKLVQDYPVLQHEHPFYPWMVLITVLFATFIAVLDSTVVNVALPNIMNAFGTNLDTVQWVITAYMLTFAVMLPLSGWLADTFGYKRCFFTAFLFFTLGSFLCSLAWNETTLIFFRVLQGIGGGLIMPIGLSIITRTFPQEKRGMAMGFWSIGAAAASSFGPGVGGVLVDNFGWSSVFLINVPIGFVGMLGVWIVQQEFKSEKAQKFDLGGFLSISTFLISLLLALSNGNASWNTGGWSSSFILVCFVIAGVSLIIFLLWEFNTPQPMVELDLLKDPNFAIITVLLLLFGIGLMGSTFLMPLYIQTSLGYTALQAGLVLVPMGIMQAIASPISGMLADKANPKIPIFIGLFLLVASLYLCSGLSSAPADWQLRLPIILMGLGFGFFFIPLQSLGLSGIPKAKIAQAGGLISLIRQIGSSFGVAVVSTILTLRNVFHSCAVGESMNSSSEFFRSSSIHLQQNMTSGAVLASSQPSLAQLQILQQAKTDAYVQSVDDIYILVTLVLLLCIIPVLLLKTQKKKTNKVE